MAINGAAMISWLFPRRLIGLGLPGDPALSYAVVGILASTAGAITLRLIETLNPLWRDLYPDLA